MTKPAKKKATAGETFVGFIIMIGIFSWLSGPSKPTKEVLPTKQEIAKFEEKKKSRFEELLKKQVEMRKHEKSRAKGRKTAKKVKKSKPSSKRLNSWNAKVKCMTILKMKLKGFKVGRIFTTLQLKKHTRQSVEMISKKHNWIKATFTCKFFLNGKFSVKKQNL